MTVALSSCIRSILNDDGDETNHVMIGVCLSRTITRYSCSVEQETSLIRTTGSSSSKYVYRPQCRFRCAVIGNANVISTEIL